MKGLFLQGAGWDMKNACLVEAEPMQLVCAMPTIHFKPVEAKRRSQRGKWHNLPLSYCLIICLTCLFWTIENLILINMVIYFKHFHDFISGT